MKRAHENYNAHPHFSSNKRYLILQLHHITTTSIQAEVSSYIALPNLKEDENPLEFWKEQQTSYPKLVKLAIRYLSVPASSAPVERLFSISGKIFRQERCRLSDEHFQKLTNIKCNSHILNKY